MGSDDAPPNTLSNHLVACEARMRLWKWFKAWLKGRALNKLVRKSGGLPSTLEDTFPRLTKLLAPGDLVWFKRTPEQSATANMHFGLGMWMRNNWGLWK